MMPRHVLASFLFGLDFQGKNINPRAVIATDPRKGATSIWTRSNLDRGTCTHLADTVGEPGMTG
jgi:hypothetical protein